MRKVSFGKRLLSMLLALVMILGMAPVADISGWFPKAQAAEGNPVVVVSGSDYQHSTSGTTMANIAKKINASPFGILMGGDYDAGTMYPNASHLTDVDNAITSAFPSVAAANRIMIQGNHETYGSLSPDNNELLDDTGAYENAHYSVYAINYEDFGSASGGLKTYLDGKTGYTKPIFVITHQPLHETNRGDNTKAINIFNVLNEAGKNLNIIFLFGHNHSSTYDDYLGGGAIYLKKGDSITVAGGSGSQTLNFTYMNCGYVGYSRSGADNGLTMTAFEIYEDEVIIKRYDANGLHNLKAKGVSTSGYTADTNVYGSAVLSLADGTSTIKTLAETESGSGGSGDSGDDNTGTDTPTTPDEPDTPATGSGNVYELDTDGVTTGEDYLIVSAGADGTAYALRNNNGSVARAEVTVSNGQIVTDAEDIVWTYDSSSYLTNGSHSFYLSHNNTTSFLSTSEQRAVAIEAIDMSAGSYSVKRDGSNYSYYLNYSESAGFTNTGSNGSAQAIYFFVRTSESGGSGGGTTTPDAPTVDTENKGWITITDGKGQVVYELDTDGVIDTGVEYLIVAESYAKALAGTASSADVVKDITIDGNYAYADSEDYGWIFTASGSDYTIRLNGSTYLGRSSSSLAEGDSGDTWTVVHESSGAYTITQESSSWGWGNTYYVRWSNSNGYFQASNYNTDPVRLYKYVRTESAGDPEYAKLSDNLTATVARGADRAAAETAIKAVVDVLVAHTADYSDAQAILDSDENITWALASNYDGNVPGEYAVTISYKGVLLGTAKVIVPDTAILCDDVVYYLEGEGPWTTPIGATVTAGTPEGQYTYEILEGGDAIIASIDDNGNITFTGTEGTAQVKITYTYTEGETSFTLEKVINVTAKAPYYTVELCDPVTVDGSTTYEPITAPIAVKGIKTGDTYSVWAVVKEYNAEHPDGYDLGNVEDTRLLWTVSDKSIATIDPATGVLTFTGTSFGTFEVTVYYLDEEGEVLCEDAVTISASESQYVVPGDGTNDFPEFPEQGAIRFDKTAVSQGDFSQSGIAKVELSMTGVPYGSSVPTDVVIMVDMTTSMYHYGYIDDADEAIKNMLEALVYDAENDKYDPNIYVQVWSFKSDDDGENVAFVENLSRRNITTLEELTAAQNAIAFDTDGNDGSGTCYDEGTKKMYEIVNSCTTENVVAVFASDGGPSRYAYLNDDGGESETSGSNASVGQDTWFNNDGSVTDDYLTEYYTYLLKTKANPVPVYTIGVGIEAGTPEAHVLEHMSSEYDASGKVVSTALANSTTDYFALADINTTPDVLSNIFEGIAASIREAATDVVVEDKIASYYTMNFSLPSGVTAAEAGMSEFYIQVLGYELDDNNDRKANPTVLEKFLFNSDGTITHTVGGNVCGETCSHVNKTGDTITGIDGTYFDYEVDANGDEFLTWEAEKLDRNELALEYFVYLDRSAGFAADEQIDAGTYPTNEYATITYKNFNGEECQQSFPVPTLTWSGAKVTYVFYLVNGDGLPVNRAGKIVPFSEAIYVTDPVTIDVTWNELEGAENMLAENLLATAKVPEVYSLYDNEAYYEIRVYQTEDTNKNYFIIEGSDNVSNKETTKVFNTKAGVRYDDYGAYSATAGSYTSHQSNKSYTTTVTNSIDYANTTVAFAVVWKPELNPDTVVVDFGLDVVIDVTTNDALASGVTGVSNTKPSAEINKGTYENGVMGTSANIVIGDYVLGTVKIESLSSVRFSLNKANGMKFTVPVEFFYESECNYYTYDNAGNRTLNTTHMYSSVTVIPATTIYYEDSFLTLESFTNDGNGNYNKDEDVAKYGNDGKWVTEGTTINATQDQDRPGESQISAVLDADNKYGYDSAYETMSKFSLGSAAKITVDANTRGEATFTFTGTGFDVISVTSNATGTLIVEVTNTETDEVKASVIDTFYGMDHEGNPVDTSSENALYQIPVIKIFGLDYGTYDVKLTAGYNAFFDHNNTDASYDLYLDAIRIYDPTGNQNQTANDAYTKDHEGWPLYTELRDNVIKAHNYTVTENEDGTVTATGDELAGMIFIDCSNGTTSIVDYVNHGPNNELYLANGQAIAFNVNKPENVDDIQLGIKMANGTAVTYTINGDTYTVSTATDMYYSILKYVNAGTVVIENVSGGILSLTNIKVTHTSAPTAGAGEDLLSVDARAVSFALMSLRRAPALEEPTPEVTEPEATEPEATEPEATEPEATEPEATEPEATEPEATEPEATEPEATEPEATEPEATEPEATEPEATEPEVNEPAEGEESGNWFSQIIDAIGRFFKNIFGWIFN